MTEESLYKP